MTRFRRAALVALLTLGCSREAVGPSIPEGAIAYRFAPLLLYYYYRDTSTSQGSPQDLEQRWLTSQPYYGYSCLGFSPRTPQDTIGTFVFVSSGSNTGSIERHQGQMVDTVPGYFFFGQEGTHGTYAKDSNNQVHLTWADGIQARYFHPSGTVYFAGDTLWARVEQFLKADSVHVIWQVAWLQDGC